MQVEEQMREFGARQDLALDATLRADEEGLDLRIALHQLTRDRETRIEMSAGAAAGEDPPPAATAGGSLAAAPTTFSRVLPMFTRMPVKSSVRMRLERPYEMKGSVSP